MRSANSSTNAHRVEELAGRGAHGSKLIPNASRRSDRRRASSASSRSRRRSRSGAPRARSARPRRRRRPGSAPSCSANSLVAALDLGEVVRREAVEHVPDRRAGEAVHLRDAEGGGRAGGVLHPLGRALLDAGRVAVAPDLGREDRPGGARRSGRRPPARRGARRAPSSRGRRAARASPSRSPSRQRPGRPRSGRPSRRARARRSPTGSPSPRGRRAAGRPTGR